MKFLRVMLVVVTIGFSASSYADEFFGGGGCGQWSISRAEPRPSVNEAANFGWLMGFLSGLASGTGVNVLVGVAPQSIAFWMDKYCRANPSNKVGTGAITLFNELKEQM